MSWRRTLPVIVRSHDDTDLDKLRAAGAAEVVPEALEGSLMLASHALVMLGVPLRRVVHRVQAARDERYASLRGYFHGAGDVGRRSRAPMCGCIRWRCARMRRRSASRWRRSSWKKLGAEVTAIRRGRSRIEVDAGDGAAGGRYGGAARRDRRQWRGPKNGC